MRVMHYSLAITALECASPVYVTPKQGKFLSDLEDQGLIVVSRHVVRVLIWFLIQ